MVEGVLSSFPCAQHMRQAQCGPRDTELSNSDFNTKKSHCSTPLGMDRPSAPDCCSSCKCWKYSCDQPCPWVDTWSCWKTALPMTWIGGPLLHIPMMTPWCPYKNGWWTSPGCGHRLFILFAGWWHTLTTWKSVKVDGTTHVCMHMYTVSIYKYIIILYIIIYIYIYTHLPQWDMHTLCNHVKTCWNTLKYVFWNMREDLPCGPQMSPVKVV